MSHRIDMCGGTWEGSPWDIIGMSYVGQSCVGWWILLANLDMSEISPYKVMYLYCTTHNYCIWNIVVST